MYYFLSDAHIGSRAVSDRMAHQQQVVRLLQCMAEDAEAIYLLGDMLDYWYEYLWYDKAKEEYAPFLTTLRSLTERGIRVYYFLGNHDLWTFGALARQTGVQIVPTPQEITLCGKRLYLGHGDGVMPADWQQYYPAEVQQKIRRFMALRRFFHCRPVQYLFRLVPPVWGNRLGYGWAAKSRRREMANPCPYKGEQHEELVLFAKEQERLGRHHDYYIFGHRHIELDLQITRDSRVLVLGDCFRQWTYAQMDNEGRVELKNIDSPAPLREGDINKK